MRAEERAAAMAAVALFGLIPWAETRPQAAPDSAASAASVLSDPARLGVRQPPDTAIQATLRPQGCAPGSRDVFPRRAAVGAVFVGANLYLYDYFRRAWWSGERADEFFFRADWDENFRDQDKFGHAFGGYHLARIGAALLRSACTSRSNAVAWSAAYAAAFQLQIEIWDGHYERYGFSWPDLLANTAGTALAALHEVRPATRAIRPTISYWPTAALRNEAVRGELRASTDYSGQTYWLSADIDALLPASARHWWPGILRFSAGHSITDWIDPLTGANLRAQRRILLSLDLDAEKLPGDGRLWKTFKRNLGYIHLPSPALQIAPRLELIGWYR